ncbi:MAG: glycosyl transferase [Thaumarchaeota archaeon]|jgi:glycosyltransferase involved in cell wall biosynthesis|nr:MAG: glycosyl transferase [Nitrososphaerota archaeon]
MKIVIGIPAYNEEKNIAGILVKLKKITQDIIVCDDGSNDQTAKIAEELGAIVISHERNLGYGAGIRTIFLKAKEIKADVLVTFDADGQHRIEDLNSVIEPIKNNEADIVIGSRFLNDGNKVPKYREIGIKTITVITNSSIGEKLSDSQSGFRAYNRKVLENITPSESGMGVSTEILIKASKNKFQIKEVPIIISYEGNTSTHNPVSHGASVILSTIKFTSIEHPLKFYGISGIFFLGLGLSFLFWTIQLFTESGKVVTNISLIGIGGIVIGIILLVTATILYSIISVVREKTK